MNKTISILALLAIMIIYMVSYHATATTVTVIIEDKERITTGSGENISSKFLVYTDGEVLENTDSWVFTKFDSADIQGALKPGKTYNIEVAGWRIPFLSWYRNIIRIKH